MPAGGQNRKTKAQKLIDGTFSKNPNRHTESLPVGSPVTKIPPFPPLLNETGQKAWVHLCNDFIVSGLMETVDLFQMEIMVRSLQRYWELENELIKDTPESIRLMDDDELRRWRDLSKQSKLEFDKFMKIANSFGMNPASRNGLISKQIDDTQDVAIELIG